MQYFNSPCLVIESCNSLNLNDILMKFEISTNFRQSKTCFEAEVGDKSLVAVCPNMS